MMLPYIQQVHAEETTNDSLKLSHKGKNTIEVTPQDQTVELTLTKKESNESSINLPDGITYNDKVDEISYDEEKNALLIEEDTSKVSFNLDIDSSATSAENFEFYATMMLDEKEIQSNDFIINVTKEQVDEEQDSPNNVTEDNNEAVVTEDEEETTTTEEDAAATTPKNDVVENEKDSNKKEDATATQKNNVVKNTKTKAAKSEKMTTPKVNQEDLTPQETIGSPWTTKPGVQAAPKPDVITHAQDANEVDVSNWTDFNAAMISTNINVIHIQDDFYNPSTGGAMLFTAIPLKDIKVNGNGHVIDFAGTSFRYTGTVNREVEWNMNHLTIYGHNNYSVMTSTGVVNSPARMVFDDVSYVGSQINANFYWLTDFRGLVESHSVNSYIRPFDSSTQATITNEMNLQVKDVLFSKDSYYHGTTKNAGAFILLAGGNMLAEENSEVVLTAGGTAGGGEYGYYLMNDTASKLNTFLLTESKANAFGIINNESIDLTEHLAVTHSDSINQMKAGVYTITLHFDLTATQPGATATRKFTVTVLNDEAVKPTNPEKPGVEEPDEVENGGTGQTGLLKLDYAPSNFDFGTMKVVFNAAKTNAIKTTSSKQWLQVSDDRADENITNWSVQVAQQEELTSKTGMVLKGAKIQIPAGELYNQHSGEQSVTTDKLNSSKVDITTTPQTIFNANNIKDKMKNISTNVWNTEDVTLTIPGGQEFEFDEYSNSIIWTLVAEP